MAREVVSDAAQVIGLGPGAARAVWHAGRDAAQGASFVAHLSDPTDSFKHPVGHAAWDDLFRAGKGAIDYTAKAVRKPKIVADDLSAGFHQFLVKNVPSASPPADTLRGEAVRRLHIGMNEGETFLNASLAAGGAVKGLGALGILSKEAKAAKALDALGILSKEAEAGKASDALGILSKETEAAPALRNSKSLSEYFEEPYTGMGHHFLPRRTTLPGWLGGGPVPSAISDSPFLLLKPSGATKGDFYKLHYEVDPHYYGGPVPAHVEGRGWSGRKLGWEKHGRLGRLWYGSPMPLKAAGAGVLGAGVLGAGAAADQISNGEGPP